VTRRLVVVLLVAAAAAAAVALNVLLLGSASGGGTPSGRLSPRTNLPPAPSWTVRPLGGRPRDEGADD